MGGRIISSKLVFNSCNFPTSLQTKAYTGTEKSCLSTTRGEMIIWKLYFYYKL